MNRRSILPRVLFGAYCALMLYLLFFQRRAPLFDGSYAETLLSNLNLKPGFEIARFLRVWNDPAYHRAAIINLLGNIGMFIPLGFCLPWVHARLRRWWKTLLAAACIIICVELVQLVTLLGHCDVDDLILNLIGAAIGYAIWFLTLRKKEQPS